MEDIGEVGSAATIRRPHAVRIWILPPLIGNVGFRRHEDGTNRRVVTRGVEVLQIQRVVPRLVVVGQPKLALAALKLDRKYDRPANQHGVDSAAKARDVEFEVEHASQPAESDRENFQLLFPRLALLDFEVVDVCRSQRTKDLVRIGGEKQIYGPGVVRGSARRRFGQCRAKNTGRTDYQRAMF